MTKPIAKARRYFFLIPVAVYFLFFCLMVKLTIQYIPFGSDIAFLRIKQQVVTSIPYYLLIFYVHVYTSIFVLLAGFTQFSGSALKKHKPIHRLVGRLYGFVVLFLSAPSGIFMGLYANGAWHTKLSFIILGTLWFSFTLSAIIAIRQKKISAHKAFMTRSFALAISAITLRAWKVAIVYLFDTAPMDTYQIIAWLGWMPNLLIAECFFINKPKI